jgi:peptidoglycan/LPS O-acetylase OafA/YrhL
MRVSDYFNLTRKKRVLVFGIIAIVLFFGLSEIRAEQSLSFLTGIIISEYYTEVKRLFTPIHGILFSGYGVLLLALKQLSVIRSAPQYVYNLVQLFIKWPVAMGIIIIGYILLSQNIRLRCFTFAGAISYELYLIHGYILPHMSGINGAILFLVFSVGMSMGYHFILEKGKVIWNSILRL